MNDKKSCGLLLRQINNSLEKRCNNKLREADLTLSQMTALIELSDTPAGKLTFKELEKRMSLAQSTTVGLISRLEQKNLVTVSGDKDDKRIKYVEITALGETFYQHARQDMEYMETRLFDGFSAEERTTLLSLLERITLTLKDL